MLLEKTYFFKNKTTSDKYLFNTRAKVYTIFFIMHTKMKDIENNKERKKLASLEISEIYIYIFFLWLKYFFIVSEFKYNCIYIFFIQDSLNMLKNIFIFLSTFIRILFNTKNPFRKTF